MTGETIKSVILHKVGIKVNKIEVVYENGKVKCYSTVSYPHEILNFMSDKNTYLHCCEYISIYDKIKDWWR